MFDNVLNSIIILIPIAIFIVRFIVQVRGKHAPPPKRPPIPVHFEDDDEETAGMRKPVKVTPPKVSALNTPLFSPLFQESAGSVAALSAIGTEKGIVSSLPSSLPASRNIFDRQETGKKNLSPSERRARNDFFVNLSKLPVLKQAVIMSEILGPPKALQ